MEMGGQYGTAGRTWNDVVACNNQSSKQIIHGVVAKL